MKNRSPAVDPRPPLVLIIGPTAVGKTEIAIQLAEIFNGEIVSADSRLFYRGMDIGTAKPTREEQTRVPHHLIDVADPNETWSLAQFQRAARNTIAGIHTRGKLPFLVGGTGQYMRAVTEGWTPPEVEPDERLRGELEKLNAAKGKAWLHEKLYFMDPEAAEKIDPRNVRRTIRSLEVILKTGKKFSAQRNHVDSVYRLIPIGLIRSREELYKRVDARIEQMFSAGLLEEVRGLISRGYSADLPAMSGIGYRECIQVIEGHISEEEAKIQMRHATRVFVRRQANWFKSSDQTVHWVNLERETIEDICKFLHKLIDV